MSRHERLHGVLNNAGLEIFQKAEGTVTLAAAVSWSEARQQLVS
jgi:hypothetical protein